MSIRDKDELAAPQCASFGHIGALLDDDSARHKLLAVFVEHLGGSYVVECLVKHYEEGWSYRKLARLNGEKEATLRNRMNRAMDVLRRHELAPLHWLEKPKQPKRHRRVQDDGMMAELAFAPDKCATFSAHRSQSYGGGVCQRLRNWVKGEDATSMPNSRDITLLLDRSGSMEPMRRTLVSGVNDFIRQQRPLPGECRVSLRIFNHRLQSVWTGESIEGLNPLTASDLVPYGYTALYDALHDTIYQIRERLTKPATATQDRRVILAILTDGVDTASRRHTSGDVLEQVRLMQRFHGWEFLFLAAGPDAIKEGANVGLGDADAHAVEASAGGIEQAMHILSATSRRRLRQ